MLLRYHDSIIFLLLSVLVYLPMTTVGNVIRLSVLALSFLTVLLLKGGRFPKDIFTVAVAMIISPFLSAGIVYLFDRSLDTSTVTHELMRMIFCAFLIITVSRLQVPFRTVYFGTLLVFLPNLTIQILQYLGNADVTDFIRKYYVGGGYSVHLELSTYTGSMFRSGSIFVNPNVYMAIPMIAMCVFFQKDMRKPNLFNHAMVVCAGISGLLTGSRTATVVMVLIMAYYYFRYSPKSSRIVFLVILGVVVLRFGSFLLDNARAIDVNILEGDSIVVKFASFGWFWETTKYSPLFWLTGGLGAPYIAAQDSEWGHIYAWYGVIGAWWYVKYYLLMWKHNQKLHLYSKVVTVTCILVSFTASLLLCMPIFSYVGSMAFSNIKQKSLDEVSVSK